MHPTKQPPPPPPRNRHERRKAATQARQKANREAKKPRWHHGSSPVPPTVMKLDTSGAYLNLGSDGFSIAGVREMKPVRPDGVIELRDDTHTITFEEGKYVAKPTGKETSR